MGVSEACMELMTSTSNLSPSQISMLVPGNIRLTAANVRLWPSAENEIFKISHFVLL